MLRTQFYTLFKNLLITEQNVQNNVRTIATSLMRCREVVDRREMLRSMPKPDEGAVGEKTLDVDAAIHELVYHESLSMLKSMFTLQAYREVSDC